MKGFDDFELRLGDILRGERATLGKSLLDVQRDLKIKATYIAAIENSDPTAFESPGFVSGYIRSYARYLNLDPEWVFNSFCEESGFEYKANFTANNKQDAKKRAKASKGSPLSTARDPLAQPSVAFLPPGEARFSGIEPRAVGSVFVLIALVGAIGYGGWSVLQEVQKVQFTPIEETPGVLAELDPVAPPETELTTSGPDNTALVAPTSEAFDRLYRPQALDVPVLTSRDGPIATIEPGSLGVLRPEPEPFDVDQFARLEAPELQGPQLPEPGSTVQVVAEEPPTLALLAVRPSWVRVSASDGTVIFEKILDAGERFELPATEEPHVLRAGNAGSLYFAVGSDTYGPAGQGASVIRNVTLSIDAVREGYVVADAADDVDLARFVAVAEAQSD